MLTACCVKKTNKTKKTTSGLAESLDKLGEFKDNIRVETSPEDLEAESSSYYSDSFEPNKLAFERFQKAFDFYQKRLFDAALQELQHAHSTIRNNPYLEMQCWYLAVEIHNKTGAHSRRNRAMRKMMESMEKLHSDRRFMREHREGLAAQDLVDFIKEIPGDRYEGFE